MDRAPTQTVPDCLDRLLTGGPILILTPHPDDEAFGCGALLSHAFAGAGAQIVCMGEGAHRGPNGSHAAPRPGEMELAIAHLGGHAEDIIALRRPPGWAEQSDTFPMLATHVGTIARAVGARRIFSTARISDDAEHRATAEIAARAAEMFGLTLCHYPVWTSWTEDMLAGDAMRGTLHRLPVDMAAATKARALAAFRSRLGPDTAGADTLPGAIAERFLKGAELYLEVAPESLRQPAAAAPPPTPAAAADGDPVTRKAS